MGTPAKRPVKANRAASPTKVPNHIPVRPPSPTSSIRSSHDKLSPPFPLSPQQSPSRHASSSRITSPVTAKLQTAPERVSPILVDVNQYRNSMISDSEDELPVRSVARRRRVVIVESDTDNSDDSPCRAHSTLNRSNVVDLTMAVSEDDEDQVDEIVDTGLPTFDSDDEESELPSAYGEARGYDVTRHYDDSLGSLRDFIIDDSDDSDLDRDIRGGGAGEESISRCGEGERVVVTVLDSDSESGETNEVDEEEGSGDALGDGTEGHDAVLYYSPPRRLITLPDLSALTLDSPSPPRPPSTPGPSRTARTPKSQRQTPAAKRAEKQNWAIARVSIAQRIFDELDREVFEGRLSNAGTEVVWCNRLLTTAGTASSKRLGPFFLSAPHMILISVNLVSMGRGKRSP